MIIDTMSLPEVSDEIGKDYSLLKSKLNARSKWLHRQQLKFSKFPAYIWMNCESPRKNKWTIAVRFSGKRSVMFNFSASCVRDTDHGKYAYMCSSLGDSVIVKPHAITRYRERGQLDIDDNNLIRRLMLQVYEGCRMDDGSLASKKGMDHQVDNITYLTCDGIFLGEAVGHVTIINTFVTYDMRKEVLCHPYSEKSNMGLSWKMSK